MRARRANPVKSGSDYESSMPKRLDRVLVAAALALAVAIGWDALARRTHAVPATKPPPPAAVPQLVRLVPSSTAFLPNCPTRDVRLAVGPGPTVTLRFAGTRCHVPPLRLHAVLRRGTAVVYDGPALASEDLSGNYAGAGVRTAPLLGCDGQGDVAAEVAGSRLAASATVRCP